ncbi:Extensin [Rhizobium sp. EC-SD404]|nr:Extensin [Rhizobium sp. EC-SD404]
MAIDGLDGAVGRKSGLAARRCTALGLSRLLAGGFAAMLLVSCSASSVLAPPEAISTSSITPQPPAGLGWQSATYGAPPAQGLPAYESLAQGTGAGVGVSSGAGVTAPAGDLGYGSGLAVLQRGQPLPVDDAALAQMQGRPVPDGWQPGYVPSDQPQILGTLGPNGEARLAGQPSPMQSPVAPVTAQPSMIPPAAAPVYAPPSAPIAAAPPVSAPVAAVAPPVAAPPVAAAPVVQQAPEPQRVAGIFPRALNPFARAREPQSSLPAAEAACRQRLQRLGVQFTDKPAVGNGNSCGIAHPVEVSGLSGGVNVRPATLLNCQMAEAFATWVKNELAPSTRKRYLSGIETVGSMGGYSCRTMNSRRGAPMSEHSKGNAIDVGSIKLNSGRVIDVSAKGLFAFRERGLLNSVRDDGCKYFNTILGPGSDANHADHFHFDLRARRNGYRHCD